MQEKELAMPSSVSGKIDMFGFSVYLESDDQCRSGLNNRKSLPRDSDGFEPLEGYFKPMDGYFQATIEDSDGEMMYSKISLIQTCSYDLP